MGRINEGCTQPQCPLRQNHAGPRFLAELVVGALAGEGVRLEPASSIEPLPRCLECVQRVMRGLKPIASVEELLREEEAGHWSWRRERRSKQ